MYSSQLGMDSEHDIICCELLSFFVSLCIVHSHYDLVELEVGVVNCFHFLYLCV